MSSTVRAADVAGKSQAAEHPFERRLAQAWAAECWRDVTTVVGVSGGPDSVALVCGLVAIDRRAPGQPRGKIVAAHFNHQLRGEEAAADEAFVVELCGRLGIACEQGKAGAIAAKSGVEEAARHSRYAFLTDLAQRVGARYVATAHTADDLAETVLHHIVRGTGIPGLAGIASARELTAGISLRRPMLGIRRAEVMGYLDTIGQSYRRDAMNADPAFTRARIRHELLPQLSEQYNPNVVEALCRLGKLAGEAGALIAERVSPVVESVVKLPESRPQCVEIDARRLAREPRYVVREVLQAAWRARKWPLQAMGYDEWDRLAELVTGAPGGPSKICFPGEIVAECAAGKLTLERRATS
jgi:tRNA(Ile)-lysidine synthase